MSQLTDYSLELMAKGWLSLNKDKPEHVQEVVLSKLLKEINNSVVKEINNTVVKSSPDKIFNSTWYMRKFKKLYTMAGIEGYCELTGIYCENLVRVVVTGEEQHLLIDQSILQEYFESSDLYKIKPDTVLL